MKTRGLRPPFGSLAELLECLARAEHLQYDGEVVSQLAHALQCAACAEQAGAAPALVVAALLHDIGHVAAALPGTPSLAGIDDRHEALGPHLLQRLYGEAVLAPIRLHVDAKRYLVATSADYARHLSDDSRRSLVLQGGALSDEECAAFRQHPAAADALRLRTWDDKAKEPRAAGPGLARYLPFLEAALAPGPA